MRLLLITGELASGAVREEAEKIERELGHEVGVLVLGIKTASLMTVGWLEEVLKEHSGLLASYDMAILPGYTRGDVSRLEEIYGVPFVKGTKHIGDLAWALKAVGPEGLSPSEPADEILAGLLDPRGKLEELEKTMGDYIPVGEVRVPVRPPPMRLISEVYYEPGIALEDLVEECRSRLEEGADIICLGFRDPYSTDRSEVRRAVRALKDEFGTLAVDDPLPDHIREALSLGADLVMSISRENARAVSGVLEPDAAYVLVAEPGLKPEEKLDVLRWLSGQLADRGVEKVVLDPLLEPPMAGFFRSLSAYELVGREFPGRPMLMGFCNVVELVDADGPGLNALLACLAAELGVSLVLTTEESRKARGSTAEASRALKMASLALSGRRPPKDLGIDLLVLKEKTDRTVRFPGELLSGALEVECREVKELAYRPDPAGFFRITVDHDKGLIIALHEGPGGRKLLRGRDWASMVECVLEMGLATRPEHLAYLAREFTKAELALRLGKSYVQGEPLFRSLDGRG